jgi:antitoxin FitA
VATLTLRDLDDSLKLSLRMRAASHNRSMEEEARQILRAALTEPPAKGLNFLETIRSRFKGLGDVQLEIPPREPGREPPDFSDFVLPKKPRSLAAKPKTQTRTPQKPRRLSAK